MVEVWNCASDGDVKVKTFEAEDIGDVRGDDTVKVPIVGLDLVFNCLDTNI